MKKKINTLINHLTFNDNIVFIFHILDPFELDFPFKIRTKFVDMESKQNLTLEPSSIKERYKLELIKFVDNVKKKCYANGACYKLCSTSDDISSIIYKALEFV